MIQRKVFLSCNEMGHAGHLFISYFDMLGMALLFPHSIDLDKLSQASKANTFLMQLSLKDFNEKLTSKHKKNVILDFFFFVCVYVLLFCLTWTVHLFKDLRKRVLIENCSPTPDHSNDNACSLLWEWKASQKCTTELTLLDLFCREIALLGKKDAIWVSLSVSTYVTV